MKHSRNSALIAVAILTVGGLGACKARDTAATDSAAGRVDSAAAATRTVATDSAHRADSLAATARSGWTEPSILGYAAAANNGEILFGQLGAKKATNAQVKAYAREMVSEHKAMVADTKALATKLSATPDTAANDVRDLLNHSRDELKDFTDKAAGKDWDKDFIDKSIDDHQKVLDKLQDAAKNTTNTDLRAALEKVTGKVQQHLTKAQDIKANALKD